MKPELAKRLRDALDCCDQIIATTSGKSFRDYLEDRTLRSSVERELTVIGEALNHARRLDPALVERIPRLHQGIAMRHRIVHGYDEIDDELVWIATQKRVPEMRMQLIGLLQEPPTGDSQPLQ